MIGRESLREVAKDIEKEDLEQIDKIEKHPELLMWRIIEVTVWCLAFAVLVFIASGMRFSAIGWLVVWIAWFLFIAALSFISYRRWRLRRSMRRSESDEPGGIS